MSSKEKIRKLKAAFFKNYVTTILNDGENLQATLDDESLLEIESGISKEVLQILKKHWLKSLLSDSGFGGESFHFCQDVCSSLCNLDHEPECIKNCPVKAITKKLDGSVYIEKELCIGCGKCTSACPYGAVTVSSDLTNFVSALKNKDKIVAITSATFSGQFDASAGQIHFALFLSGIEVISEAADFFEDYLNKIHLEHSHNNSSRILQYCPAFVTYIQKHHPKLAPYIYHLQSPLLIGATEIRKRFPDHKIVFIGPCHAKRKEIVEEKSVDWILTYEELAFVFAAKNIVPSECKPVTIPISSSSMGKKIAMSGSFTTVMKQIAGHEFRAETIDGIDKTSADKLNKCLAEIENIRLLEGRCCAGGCSAGPGVLAHSDVTIHLMRGEALAEDDFIRFVEV